jgi:SET domain-containing protein
MPYFHQFRLESRASQIDRNGLFALEGIPARRKIGEMEGEPITQNEARRRARTQRRIAIVETGPGKAIDAARHGNAWKFINHSCLPNTFMRVCRGHVEFYALRDIQKGEELTCDYIESHHNGTLPCRCGTVNCRGYI